jgi:hypothetical protein
VVIGVTLEPVEGDSATVEERDVKFAKELISKDELLLDRVGRRREEGLPRV